MRNVILNIRPGNSNHQHMAPPSGSSGQPQSQGNRNTYYNSYGSYQPASANVPQQSPSYTNGGGVSSGGGYLGASRAPHSDSLFKNTPFYTIESRIGHLHTCQGKAPQNSTRHFCDLDPSPEQSNNFVPVMNNHRNSITINLKTSDHPDLARCTTYSSTKLMVFCGSENVGPQDIQFPHQSEIKVNSDDVKHNLRGLKNKPGSTHPVDITPFLRLKQSNYTNTIEFTYALTTKVRGHESPAETQVRQFAGAK